MTVGPFGLLQPLADGLKLFVKETIIPSGANKVVFLMAPIHHHFEKKGWAEPQIVIRFWIISLILAMVGLAPLKVR